MYCILGSHKMKGTPRVITLEEPNLEGNINQLGGKYWYFPHIHLLWQTTHYWITKQAICTQSIHAVSTQRNITNYNISFWTWTEPTMTVELIVTFPVVQFIMLPKLRHLAYNTTVTLFWIPSLCSPFSKEAFAINTCWSLETILFIRRAWIDLWPLIFQVPSCFEPQQQNMMSGKSNF